MKEIDAIIKQVTRIAYRRKGRKISNRDAIDSILNEMKKLQELSDSIDSVEYVVKQEVVEPEKPVPVKRPKLGPIIRNPELTFEPVFDYSDEVWKSLYYKGDGLLISSYGRIKRRSSGRMLKDSLNDSGRKVVSVGATRTAVFVHKLVALAFIGVRPDGYEIDHINGNRLDNRAVNLEYVTHDENIRRAIEKGLIKR